MITLPELLRDPTYREFFSKVPKDFKPAPGRKPWRLYIQQEVDGTWSRKDFESYADAYKVLVRYLKGGRLHDGAIQSRGIAFAPPQRIAKVTKAGKPVMVVGSNGSRQQKTITVEWRPRLSGDEEAHSWCTYCRRPTVFRWFKSHHAFRGSALADILDPSDQRCTICGAREQFVRSTLGTARPVNYDPRHVLRTSRRRNR